MTTPTPERVAELVKALRTHRERLQTYASGVGTIETCASAEMRDAADALEALSKDRDDLLAACRIALARYESQFGKNAGGETGSEREQITAAIAKASGEKGRD